MALTDVFAPIKRRTKAAYARLFDQPNYLFGRGTRTIIFPNGAREIWISNADGTAKFAIRASDGPAGFGVTISAPVGTLPADAHVVTRADYVTHITAEVREITFVSHYQDAFAQQFRRWYACDTRNEQGQKTEPYPADLGLTPRETPAEVVD